jgi:hypothetical protein
MTGELILAANPTTGLGAATKTYVDDGKFYVSNICLQRGGGSMYAPISLYTEAFPTLAGHVTHKGYVDAKVAAIVVPTVPTWVASTQAIVDANLFNKANLSIPYSQITGVPPTGGSSALPPWVATTQDMVDVTLFDQTNFSVSYKQIYGIRIGYPTEPTDPTSKSYVDAAVAASGGGAAELVWSTLVEALQGSVGAVVVGKIPNSDNITCSANVQVPGSGVLGTAFISDVTCKIRVYQPNGSQTYLLELSTARSYDASGDVFSLYETTSASNTTIQNTIPVLVSERMSFVISCMLTDNFVQRKIVLCKGNGLVPNGLVSINYL